MKPVGRMSPEEVAGLVWATLQDSGITATVTGGGCVGIWSEGKYVSRDLDFIEEGPVPRRQVKAALARIGFVEKNRYFVHPETDCFVEFLKPPAPETLASSARNLMEDKWDWTLPLSLLQKAYGYRHFDVSATQRTCQEIMAAEGWNPHVRQR